MKEIDLLVTGLPVSQFQDESLRADLEARFSGEHQVTKKRTVNVKKVKVVAQPIGGLLDYVNEVEEGPEDQRITDENRRSFDARTARLPLKSECRNSRKCNSLWQGKHLADG